MYDSSATSCQGKRMRIDTGDQFAGESFQAKRQKCEDSLPEAAETFLLARDHVLPGNNAIQAKLIARQKKGRTQAPTATLTDAQRRAELLNSINDPNYNKTMKAQQDQIKAKLKEADENETRVLLVEMDHAVDEDHSAILAAMKTGQARPAMHRFSLLPKLDTQMKRKGIQGWFLQLSGCSVLERWLSPNPDRSYPPQQIVEQVLDILDALPIELEHLQNCNIAKVLRVYSGGYAQMDAQIMQRSTHLLQRWQVTVYNLSYEYDEDGLHELRHRELRRKLEVVKKVDPADVLKDSAKQDGTVTYKEDELIRKAPNGRFVMFKSNFDFLEKPKGYLESDEYLMQGAAAAEGEEESKVATEAQMIQRSGKNGKQLKSGKSVISGVLTSHHRQNQGAVRKIHFGFV